MRKRESWNSRDDRFGTNGDDDRVRGIGTNIIFCDLCIQKDTDIVFFDLPDQVILVGPQILFIIIVVCESEHSAKFWSLFCKSDFVASFSCSYRGFHTAEASSDDKDFFRLRFLCIFITKSVLPQERRVDGAVECFVALRLTQTA